MTPADRRIKELTDKWLASIDLHLKYVELSDDDYARVQPWPQHDRPTRWVLEVARQKILELQAHAESRRNMSDGKFSESLELMAFLANLVGIQHIQRFIPLASPRRGQDEPWVSAPNRPSDAPKIPEASRPAEPSKPPRPASGETTREMPRLARPTPTQTVGPAATRQEQGKESGKDSHKDPGKAPRKDQEKSAGATPPQGAPAHKAAAKSGTAKTSPAKASSTSVHVPTGVPADMKDRIIADAVRLLKWGKPWHELAELIARIADRPPAGEVRKVLRTNRNDIEAKAQR